MEIKMKLEEMPNLKLAPYSACIDRSLLQNLLFMGKLDAITPNATIMAITSDELEACMRPLVQSTRPFDPTEIELALEKVKWSNGIKNADAIVTTYYSELFA